MVQHNQKQVKFEYGANAQNYDLVMVLFLLGFWLNCGFRSINVEGMQQFYLKFTE